MFRLNGVCKNIHDKVILEDVSFTIKPNQIVGLVGINGAGKTTLMKCMMGIYDINGGYIDYNGVPISNGVEWKKDVFFLSDDPYYPSDATMTSLYEFYETFYTLDQSRFNKYCALFKLNKNQKIKTFSKGMKRQAFLSIALSTSLKLLLLDEAFDGLDPKVRLILKKTIVEDLEQLNTSVIISSHSLRELEDICESFLMLDQKRLVQSGDIQKSKEEYHKIQLVLKENVELMDVISGLEAFNVNSNGRVHVMMVKGKLEDVLAVINKSEPLLCEALPISFEELFMIELERGERHG